MTRVTLDIARALAAVPYLRALPAAERRVLAAGCAMRTVPRGTAVFEEGRPATGLWVVVDGGVTLVRSSARGRQQVLHAEGPGATLAEVPVFDAGGYVATAVAVVDTRVLFVPREALLTLCRRRPDVALGVIATLARRVRRLAGVVADLSLRDVTARLAALLLEASAGRDVVTLPGTRDDIAARIGSVRERVSRSLSSLARRGAITVHRRRITIRDRATLTAIAAGE